MQSSGYPRFYGGHYDSTKQKDVRDHIIRDEGIQIWREELKQRYTARLRLDILLAGNVVITDAQFYDGLFFQSLVDTGSLREDFFDFLKHSRAEMDAPLVEVRRREGGLDKMLGRPFIFSSLITRDAKDTVKSTMAEVLSAMPESERRGKNWQDFLDLVDEHIEKPAVKDALGEIRELLSYLNEAPQQIFVEWEPLRVSAFPQLIESAKQETNFSVPTTGNNEINDTLTRIDAEMQKDFPNRSNIEQWINTCKNSDPSDYNRQKMLTDLWNAVCQVYNTAIADQHRCTSVDFGETDLQGSDAGSLVESLSNELISVIAEEPWEEFLKHLTKNKKLMKAWTDFRFAISNPMQDKYYGEKTRRLLEVLIKALQSSYGHSYAQLIKSVIGGGTSSTSYSANGLSFKVPSLGTLYRVIIACGKARKDRSTLIKCGMKIHGL